METLCTNSYCSVSEVSPRRGAAASMAAEIRNTQPVCVPFRCRPHPHEPPGQLPLPAHYLLPATASLACLVASMRADGRLTPVAPLVFFSARGEGNATPLELTLTGQDLHYLAAADGCVHLLYLRSGSSAPGSSDSAPGSAPSTPTGPARDAVAKTLVEVGEFVGGNSPHGGRLPEGATAASCTFLNPRASVKLLPPLRPARGGHVPRLLYVATFLDMCAAGLVVPLLASYTRSLGGSARFTGLLQASYGLSQLIGANLFGGLSDRLGRKRVLQLSLFGGILGYLSLAAAVGHFYSLRLLLLSRLPIGLLKQTLTAARAVAADCSTPASRMQVMTRLGCVVGAGFVLGPGVGGVMGKRVGPAAPPILAAALFAIALLIVSVALPETAPVAVAEARVLALLKVARQGWVRRAESGAANAGNMANAANIEGARGVGGDLGDGAPLVCSEDALRSLLEDLLPRWRYEGEMALPAEVAATVHASFMSRLARGRAIGADKGSAAQRGGGSDWGPTRWPVVAQVLAELYLEDKEEGGFLHVGGAKHVWASAAPLAPAAGEREETPPAAAPQPRLREGGSGRSGPAAERMGLACVAAAICARASLSDARQLLNDPSLAVARRLLLARSVLEFGVMLMHSVFADYTRTKYNWDAKQTGYAMAYSGLLSFLIDLLLLPALLQRRLLSERSMTAIGAAAAALGLTGTAIVSTSKGFLTALAALAVGASLFKSAASTLVLNAARRERSGLASGGVDAMEALCRVLAPVGGGVLIEATGVEAPPIAAALTCLVGGALMWTGTPGRPKQKRA